MALGKLVVQDASFVGVCPCCCGVCSQPAPTAGMCCMCSHSNSRPHRDLLKAWGCYTLWCGVVHPASNASAQVANTNCLLHVVAWLACSVCGTCRGVVIIKQLLLRLSYMHTVVCHLRVTLSPLKHWTAAYVSFHGEVCLSRAMSARAGPRLLLLQCCLLRASYASAGLAHVSCCV